MSDNNQHNAEKSTRVYGRRDLLASAAAAAAVGAVGVYAASETVEAAPTGTFPESADDPLLKIRADRVRWIGRTTDPSANDGETWYRSDL